jgi:hypothetical protein
MRRLAILLVAGVLASTTGTVSAATPPMQGFLPADAHPHGYSLVDLGTAWNAWAFSAPPESNPFLAERCEQSPIDPKIWFLPEPNPYGGPPAVTCEVPQGAFLVFSPFFLEWSQAELIDSGLLDHPASEAELRAAVEEWFALLGSVEVAFDGQTATTADLADYIVVTDLDTLPAGNFFSLDPTDTMNKGFFMVIAPPSRGTHMLSANFDIPELDLVCTLTITLKVR